MTTDNDNKNDVPEEKRRPVTISLLTRPSICKKRYGQATVTIRRWGGYGVLTGDRDLVKKAAAYRAGEAAAEDVAWAFVRARVESHSPTFSWTGAHLERLIKLVTECSESPHFEAQTPKQLADELVKAQDTEREQMKRLSAQFAQSFAGVGDLSKLLQPQLTQWATQQQRLFVAMSRSFVTPQPNKQLTGLATPQLSKQLAGLVTPSIQEQMRAVGLTASVRKAMFPALQPALARSLVGVIPTQSLLAQRVRLPDTLYGGLSKSLQNSLGLYRTQTLTPALEALTRHQSFTIGEVVSAAREAAELSEQHGKRAQAQALVTLTAEVVEVVEAPSVEKLERMVGDLSEHLNERLGELQEQQAANEEQRQDDRQDDLTLNVFLWFLAIYLALFLFLLEYAPKN
jgi:hypothetical protein